MLTVNDIHTYYGSSYVIQGVSFTVEEHSVVALLGRNGMGKSTTVRSIMGMTPPRRGSIQFEGRELRGLSSHAIARAGMALVPQGRRIFPSLTVEENLLVAARPGAGTTLSWDLDRTYELFPILGERRRQPGALLSGGQQQVLAISRALMTNPKMLLLDEPSEGLSPTVLQQVTEVIGRLKALGLSILLVEQNVNMALDVSDYVYILSKGKVVHEGESEAVRREEAVMASHLGVAS
jgi:branched-chain amino acid transport system ATP-binding protein